MSLETVQRVRMPGRLALLGTLTLAQTMFAQQPCEKLTDLKLANMEITSAAASGRTVISRQSGTRLRLTCPPAVL